MKYREYKLEDGTIFFLDDGHTTESYGDLLPHLFNGEVHLHYLQGRISQELLDQASAKIVGVQSVASLRRFTVMSDRISNLSDAEELTDELVYQLNRILRRGPEATARQRVAKSSARSTTTVKRRLGRM